MDGQPMVSPDEGMRSLFAAWPPGPFHPSDAPAAGTSGPAAAEFELDLGARLVICLEGVSAALGKLAGPPGGFTWEECHPVQITPNVSALQPGGLYLIDDPDRWGPRKGWAWYVTRLTIAMNSGLLATVFRDAPTSGNELLYSVAAGTWEPNSGEVLLPGQRIVVQATGQAVVNGEALEIWLPRLGDFLAGR